MECGVVEPSQPQASKKKYAGTYNFGADLFSIWMDPITNFSCKAKNQKLWYLQEGHGTDFRRFTLIYVQPNKID